MNTTSVVRTKPHSRVLKSSATTGGMFTSVHVRLQPVGYEYFKKRGWRCTTALATELGISEAKVANMVKSFLTTNPELGRWVKEDRREATVLRYYAPAFIALIKIRLHEEQVGLPITTYQRY